MRSFLHTESAMGAITSTVATFSTKAEIMPVITKTAVIALPVSGIESMIVSARRFGTREYKKSSAIMSEPI